MKLSMIYMASGFGRRFGENKLLVPLNGRALYLHGLTHLAEAARILYRENGWECEILLVSQYPEILENGARAVKAITGEGNIDLKCIENHKSQEGITASLKYGTLWARQDTDAFLFFVADQPYLESRTLADFADGFLKSGKKMGCVSHEGVFGNPCGFRSCCKEDLLSLEGDKGGKSLLKKAAGQVWTMEAEERELFDIDSRKDLTQQEGI